MGVLIDPRTNRPFGEPENSGSPMKALRRLRASYDAAQQSRDLQRWWIHADGLSADQANSPGVRRVLRNRARYEFANNSYCMGLALTLANDLIGWGPSLRMQIPDEPKVNAFISLQFNRWARRVRLAAKLRTMKVARAIDGEAFAQQITNPLLKSPVQLDIRLCEADQITTPDQHVADPNACDGIRFDSLGNPLEYHRLKYHPGSPWATLQYDPVPADRMIHWFREDRAGQRRGIPEITPSLMLFAFLRRWTLATVQAAELQADYTLFMKTMQAPSESTSESEPFDLMEVERGMMTVLPDGYEPKQLEPNQPSSSYKEGKREFLAEIARCQNVPYNVAACDSSTYNFASGRLDHLPYYRGIDVERDDLEIVAVDRVLGWWLEEAMLVWPRLKLLEDVLRDPDVPHEWDWPALEEGDVETKSKSREIDLSCGMTSYQTEFAKMGLDADKEMEKQAASLGLPIGEYRRRLADKLLAVKQPGPVPAAKKPQAQQREAAHA